MSKRSEKAQATVQGESAIPASEKPDSGSGNGRADIDVRFLLVEYDRLKGLEISNWEIYYARFNSFMTVALGALAAYVALITANPPALPTYFPVPDLLLLVILVWGILTFLGLTELSYGIKHLVNALREIQAYFTHCCPDVSKYLYYDAPTLYQAPSRFEYFVSRWLLTASPKTVLAVVNGALSAVLIARLLAELQWPSAMVVLGAIVAFVAIGLLHPIYVTFAYRRQYLTP